MNRHPTHVSYWAAGGALMSYGMLTRDARRSALAVAAGALILAVKIMEAAAVELPPVSHGDRW